MHEYSIQGLEKSYNKKVVVNIDRLHFSRGQFVALMGKNGSGKSTLMRVLAQQELFEKGDVKFRGTSLTSSRIQLNPQLTFISEDHELPFAVPLQNWVETYKKRYPKYDSELLMKLSSGLEVDLSKSFHSLSRGQKMKALFCLESPKRPQVYILDEITSVLDVGSRWYMTEFLKTEVDRGCLVIMSTNVASEMQGFATDLILLENGKIQFQSASGKLNEHFVKLRFASGQDPVRSKESGARRIGRNSDATWTYLIPRQHFAEGDRAGSVEDLREISIADVQSYFTTGEVAR